jgi:tetrapyrrole methylase family protein / MazG family protein
MTIAVVGLGPGSLDRVPTRTLDLLTATDHQVIVRTLHHPAAAELAARREVRTCDDLYELGVDHAAVYEAGSARVMAASGAGPVVYAVPGSPLVGETSVGLIRRAAGAAGIHVEVLAAESFLDVALVATGVDPLEDGLQVLDAQDLPHQLVLQVPTIIGHLTIGPLVDEVRDRLLVVLDADSPVTVLTDLGSSAERVEQVALGDLGHGHAGLRVSLFVSPAPAGVVGVVDTMRRLRAACPWDAAQTHRSILPNLVEETFEAHEALGAIGADVPGEGDPDWGAYADAEEELGDVLLQVLFHTTMAEEVGGFSLESVATELRRKLERRHPHVYGDAEAGTAEETLQRWEAIKDAEQRERASLMDGVAIGLPAISRAQKLAERATKVGFDWGDADGVLDTLRGELTELVEARGDQGSVDHEWGDVALTLVNLARHLGVDPERSLREAAGRFEQRFRTMERLASGTLAELDPAKLETLWAEAKELGGR